MAVTQVTPLLNETMANLLTDQVKNYFNAQLQLVDNQYTDGISLEPIKTESYFISDKFETLQCPACYVLFGNMAFNYTENQNYLDTNTECVIVITGEDMGAGRLQRKMWRYGRVLYGIMNLVDLKSSDGRLELKVVPRRMSYGERVIQKMGGDKKVYRQDCILELELMHFEKNITEI